MKAKTFALLFFCLFGFWGWAQEQGSGSGSGSGSGQDSSGSGSGRSGRSSRSARFQRPIFLSGKVILDDGSAPTRPVTVGLVCQGTVVRQAYTSSGGGFSFQLSTGRSSQDGLQPMDASVSSSQHGGISSRSASGITAGPFGNASSLGSADSLNLSACELVAELPGFQSDRIALGSRRALDNPDVGAIVLHQIVISASGTVSLKALAAPKKAAEAFEKAGKELRKTNINFPKVTAELEKAVEIYPEFAEAWQVLGEVRLELQDREGGRDAFERASAADPRFALPFLSLAAMELDDQQWEAAAEMSHQALEINPRLAKARYFGALADSSLGNLDEAETSALWVQSSSEADSYPVTHYILGWIQAKRGNFELAATEYWQFMEFQPTAPVGKELQEQLDQWESLGLINSAKAPDPEE
jgi:Tfp pilus assembly protein PilF